MYNDLVMTDNPEASEDKAGQVFDTAQFGRVIHLEPSFLNYGLTEQQKTGVVEILKGSSDILVQSLTQDGYRERALNFLSNLLIPNDNIPAIQEYGYSFLDTHLSQIESVLTSCNDYNQKKRLINYIMRLSESGNKEQQSHVIESLQRILNHDLASGLNQTNSYAEKDNQTEYLGIFRNIFHLGTDDQIIESTNMIASAWDNTAPESRQHIGKIAANIMTDRSSLQISASRELAQYILKDYGLNFTQLVGVWGNYSTGEAATGITSRNVEAIVDLEAARPGIAKVLNQEFDISLFHRYPTELLIDQFDSKDDINVSYGIMVSAIADHNQAFGSFGYEAFMKSMHYELRKIGYKIRMYEGGTADSVKTGCSKANQRYGVKSPQFLVIAGHGTPNNIQMNWERPGHPERIIQRGFFSDNADWKLTDHIRDNGKLILLSCSTGVEGGIAQDISASNPGVMVTGPDKDSGARGVRIQVSPDNIPNIDIMYMEAQENKYENGQLIVA